ncbi:uncharacterized protein DUF3175 [Paraburkholderia bryophila]|jgi:hypothetical protein|uniref:Uncharacterized protein DUF3175 n=1 Tax=Paraburkholderia bryophila TaxID=420952 RepID=A0A329CH18_9BURK|nr:uncharacterized protein DUF3175 [Paraburkholderia bryophila]
MRRLAALAAAGAFHFGSGARRSAMSMLNFYLNRTGKNLPRTRRATLQQAKRKLREAFGREP